MYIQPNLHKWEQAQAYPQMLALIGGQLEFAVRVGTKYDLIFSIIDFFISTITRLRMERGEWDWLRNDERESKQENR